MIEQGTHKAIVLNHGLQVSSKKGTDGVFIEFDVDGLRITADLWMTDSTIERVVEQVRLCGFTGVDFEDLNTQPPILKGNKVQIVVGHESYTNDNGETITRAVVKWINDPNFSGGRKRVEAASQNIRRFNAFLGKGTPLLARQPAPAGARISDGGGNEPPW